MSLGESGTSTDGKQTQDLATAGASSSETGPAQKSTTVKDAFALANAIAKLKVGSSERFELAKESFNKAGDKASEAFHNAVLSIEDRILASQVRIASAILEHLEEPVVAASDCLQYLEELHVMPAIQDIFSVYFKGGIKSSIKSIFKKDSRAEIVETVILVNLILADFISTLTTSKMGVFDWPMIQCGSQVFHPIHYDQESLPNLEAMRITPPWEIIHIVVEGDEMYSHSFNTKNELLCFSISTHGLQKIDKTTGKLQPYCPSSKNKTKNIKFYTHVAVDDEDSVYVVASTEKHTGYTLSVYAADGTNTLHCRLRFLDGLDCGCIAVAGDKSIVLCCVVPTKDGYEDVKLYFCDNKGQLMKSFPSYLTDDHTVESMFVSRKNEIILATTKSGVFKPSHVLYFYSKEDGELQRKVKCRPSHGMEEYDDIFYNHISESIVGFANDDDVRMMVEYQTGEHRCSYWLHGTNLPKNMIGNYFILVGHSNGALALVSNTYVVFLKTPSV